MSNTLKFVLVDDDPICNKICRYAISKSPRVESIKDFLDPVEALEFIEIQYREKNPGRTILLLDINMPDLSGWEFLEVFEKFGEDIKAQFNIYILTSSVSSRDRTRADAHPLIKGYLLKPFNQAAIDRILGEALPVE